MVLSFPDLSDIQQIAGLEKPYKDSDDKKEKIRKLRILLFEKGLITSLDETAVQKDKVEVPSKEIKKEEVTREEISKRLKLAVEALRKEGEREVERREVKEEPISKIKRIYEFEPTKVEIKFNLSPLQKVSDLSDL